MSKIYNKDIKRLIVKICGTPAKPQFCSEITFVTIRDLKKQPLFPIPEKGFEILELE